MGLMSEVSLYLKNGAAGANAATPLIETHAATRRRSDGTIAHLPGGFVGHRAGEFARSDITKCTAQLHRHESAVSTKRTHGLVQRTQSVRFVETTDLCRWNWAVHLVISDN